MKQYNSCELNNKIIKNLKNVNWRSFEHTCQEDNRLILLTIWFWSASRRQSHIWIGHYSRKNVSLSLSHSRKIFLANQVNGISKKGLHHKRMNIVKRIWWGGSPLNFHEISFTSSDETITLRASIYRLVNSNSPITTHLSLQGKMAFVWLRNGP